MNKHITQNDKQFTSNVDAGESSRTLTPWQRLDRFLMLGTEDGVYCVNAHALQVTGASSVATLLRTDGVRVVSRIREVSTQEWAYQNDSALFALALAFAVGDDATRATAADALPIVARTAAHLFTFMGFVDGMRGWGRGLRRAVAGWYLARDMQTLAREVSIHAHCNGWTHRDALRLAHPKAPDVARNALFAYIVGKAPLPEGAAEGPWGYLRAVEQVRDATLPVDDLCRLIITYHLPCEVLPAERLTVPAVWEALLEVMPMSELLRHLATLTRVGVLVAGSAWTTAIAARLTDVPTLRAARLHPMQMLAALTAYRQGDHEPASDIVEALDTAFYQSFDAVQPTGKRVLLALDISRSMDRGSIHGMPGVTPRVASAALALFTAATEPGLSLVGFTVDGITPLAITPRQRLDEVLEYLDNLPAGAIDCAQLMTWVNAQQLPVDAFVILTDHATCTGSLHPTQALTAYREAMQHPAQLIIIGMTSPAFTTGDPTDAGTLHIAGFSPEVPGVVSDFVRG